jgi:hypothetical protein
MGKCRTKLDGLRQSFLSQNSLRILIPETCVSQNVLFRYEPQQLVHGNIGGFSSCGLLGSLGAEGGKELVVNCTCIVEESANDALNSFDTFCGERRAAGIDMDWFGGLAENDFAMLVRRELALGGHGMDYFPGWTYLPRQNPSRISKKRKLGTLPS